MRVVALRLLGASALALASLVSIATAFCADNTPPKFGDAYYEIYKKQADEIKNNPPFESGATSNAITTTACYSPFHNAQYPLDGASSPGGLDVAMADDFNKMKDYVTVVRTYYSSYYGYSVAKPAKAAGITLHMGVFMTDADWGFSQYTDAVQAVRDFPDTVTAILVGNENVPPVGPYPPSQVSAKVSQMRDMVRTGTGRSVPVGTVQRATDWLDESRRAEMLALASNCDIIGVNIYPFFDPNYNAAYPLVILNAVWDRMVAVFGADKLRLTEIGFPTAGSPPSNAPRNVPSLANAMQFYNAFLDWNPSSGGGPAFWFMFFDRQPRDNTMVDELEKYFGLMTYTENPKSYPVYPKLLSAQGGSSPVTSPPATSAPMSTTRTPPATTTAPPPATTRPPPTTTAPPPTTTRPPPTTTRPPPATAAPTSGQMITIVLPPASLPVNACRVRKVFF